MDCWRRFEHPTVKWGSVAVLIAVHFALALTSAKIKSPTADEYSYVSTGYLYVKTGDLRLDRTHPPLIRYFIGVPLQWIDIRLPDLHTELWDTVESYFLGYRIGWEMLLGGYNEWETILFLARLPIMILSCILALLIFLWARRLYGEGGAFVSLILYCFSPNMLAHARLATIDLGISLFFFATLFGMYRFWKTRTTWILILTGILFGCALAAKVTALLLLPILAAGLVWILFEEKRAMFPEWSIHMIRYPFLLFGVAIGTLLVLYGFPLQPCYYLDTIQNVISKTAHGGGGGADIPGMPHRNYAFYLLGDYSTQGWPYYFLIAAFVKTPISVFLVLLLILCFGTKRWMGFPDLLILGGIAILHIAALFNHVNIGLRHILPFYPLLFLYMGRIVWLDGWGDWGRHGGTEPSSKGRLPLPLVPSGGTEPSSKGRLRFPLVPTGMVVQWTLILLGGWYIVANFSIYPDYIPYFNELAGGPSQGHTILDDSNLDWGQDVGRLTEVQKQFPDEPLYVATNWMFVPEAFHLDAVMLKEEQIPNPPKGIVAVGKHWAIRQRRDRRSAYYFDWFEKYEAVGNVGHSILLYRFLE